MFHDKQVGEAEFRERLIALGIDIPPGADAEQACTLAVRGFDDQRARALRQLVEDLLASSATVHPAVRKAISRTLLPALVPGLATT